MNVRTPETGWCYWNNAEYYQRELQRRAVGELPEMESAKCISRQVGDVFEPGDNILDAGCGAGHYLLSLRRILKGKFDYKGVDITAQHVSAAQSAFAECSNVSFQTGDIRELPFNDKEFAVTICANTIPHMPQAARGLRELVRVTRKHLFVRMLVGNEIIITKKAYSDVLDEQGEPLEFAFVNIYTEKFVIESTGVTRKSVAFLTDDYDPKQIENHFEQHRQVSGISRATRVLDGLQVKGYLLLPWKVVHVKLV